MIAIPEIEGLTQAASFGDIDEMASSYIAVSTGTPIENITVRIVEPTP